MCIRDSCNIAQEMGFLVFPVEVNRFTVKETIHKALSIADTQKYARYSQKNIDTILSNQAEAVITVDQDNEITFFNKSAEKLFAVSGADVIGRKSWNIFPQNTFEAVLKLSLIHISPGAPCRRCFGFIRKRGSGTHKAKP